MDEAAEVMESSETGINENSLSDIDLILLPVDDGNGCCSSTKRRFVRGFKAINVEPALFLFSIHMGILQTLQQPFLYYRKCLDIYFNQVSDAFKFCHHLSDYNSTAAEDIVSTDVDNLAIYISVATCLPAVLLCPIIGAWSDASGGRKKPILLALAGVSLMDLTYLLCISIPQVSLYWLLLGCAVSSLAGQQMIIFAVGFALITDDARTSITKENLRLKHEHASATKSTSSEPENSATLPGVETARIAGDSAPNLSRSPSVSEPLSEDECERWISTRISIGSAVIAFGIVLGSLILSWFRSDRRLHLHSFIYSVICAEVTVVLAFFYTLFVVRENPAHIEAQLRTHARRSRRRDDRACSSTRRFVRLIGKRLSASLQTLTSPRPGYRRAALILTLFLHSLFISWYYGTETIILLFVKRFSWSDGLYGYYEAFTQGLGGLGMLIFPPLIQLCVPSRTLDTTIILVGILNSCAFYLIVGLSQSSWMIWLGGAFIFLADVDEPGFSALYSKLVSEAETARVFTLMAIVQNVAPIIGTALFNSVYSQTVGYFAGFAFVLAASLHVPVLLGIGCVHYVLHQEGKLSRASSERTDDESSNPEALPTTSEGEQSYSNIIQQSETQSVDNPQQLS